MDKRDLFGYFEFLTPSLQQPYWENQGAIQTSNSFSLAPRMHFRGENRRELWHGELFLRYANNVFLVCDGSKTQGSDSF